MITLLFGYAGDKVLITVDGVNVYFSSTAYGAQKATIDGLDLNYEGVCREHPDLETNPNWKGIAISRFKEKIKKMETEQQRAKYLIEDLSKFGYIPEKQQRNGFRPTKIKWRS